MGTVVAVVFDDVVFVVSDVVELLSLFSLQPEVSFKTGNSSWPVNTDNVPPPIHDKTCSPNGVNVYPSGVVRVSHGSIINASTIGFLHISSQLTPCCCD